MKVKYLYVMIDCRGICWAVRDGGTERVAGLASLLEEGWRPVRETPFYYNFVVSYILILLERD